MNAYEVQCSYDHPRHDGSTYRANARYFVFTEGDIASAIGRVQLEHPGCEVHQIIKRTHGTKALIAADDGSRCSDNAPGQDVAS